MFIIITNKTMKEYRFTTSIVDGYNWFIEDLERELRPYKNKIVTLANVNSWSYSSPTDHFLDSSLENMRTRFEIDGMQYEDVVFSIDTGRDELTVDSKDEVWCETTQESVPVTDELYDKFEKAVNDNFTLKYVEARGSSQGEWDRFFLVYKGDTDEDLEKVFLGLKDIFWTGVVDFALESRDIHENMHSDWKVVDSEMVSELYYDEDELKNSYIERFPQIKENLLEEVYHYN